MSEPVPPRPTTRRSAGIVIGVLTALLGFGIAVQVRSNSASDNLSGAREDDLIHILDDQNSAAERLRQRIVELQTTLRQLQASGSRDTVAKQQVEQEVQSLTVLLGTVPATGPGVRITITDPQRKLTAEDLLDVVEELRGAGAEAIQFGSVRVSTSTSFASDGGTITVDGRPEQAPFTVLAIGDPKTLNTALNIPGGVAATARAAGGDAQVVEQDRVDIVATREIAKPRFASPSPH